MELRRAEPEAIAAAARRLEAGGLVAFPTETVYGLGADATRPEAVAAVFELKGRPRFNPLIVHVLDLEAAARHGEVGAGARRLAARFWPGPLTLVLRRRDDCAVCPLAAAGLDTLALRAPSHPVARALLGESGLALAAPSANPSGRLSPTAARHVARAFPGADLLVLDAGASELGLESTVVDLSDPERAMLLRPGSIGAGEVAAALGSPVHDGMAGRVRAPGMSEGHYAPRAALRLGAARAGPGECFLGFGDMPATGAATGAAALNLSPSGDLREAAANLFAMLHELDRPGIAAIAVAPIPARGLGLAIMDRLRRAAAGR